MSTSTRLPGVDAMKGKADVGLQTFGEMIVLGIQASTFVVVDIVRGRFSWREFMEQAWFMTRVALLPTILVAIPFGVIVAVQVGAVAQQIGATSFTGAVNGIGVLRQGAPLVTSLLMAGAVGSAVCAGLGSQTVREEVDAMRVMGLNPTQRLVAPRVAAAVVVGSLLNVVVALSAMSAGYRNHLRHPMPTAVDRIEPLHAKHTRMVGQIASFHCYFFQPGLAFRD